MPRIPGITYSTPVTSMGRENPMSPVRETAAIARAINVSSAVAHQIFTKINNRRIEHAETQASVTVDEQASIWEQEQPPAERGYDPATTDIPTEVDIPQTKKVVDRNGEVNEVLRDRIETFELYPQLREKYYRNLIETQASTIPSKRVREQWIKEKMGVFNRSQAKVVAQAMQDAERFRIKTEVGNINKMVEIGYYEKAAVLINQSSLPQDTKEELHFYNNHTEETAWYNKHLELARHAIADPSLAPEAIAGLRVGLKKLEDPEYREKGGLFNQMEQEDTARELASALNSLQSSLNTRDSANIRLIRDDVNKLINSLYRGEFIDNRLIRKTEQDAARYPEKLNVELRNLQYAKLMPQFLQQARSLTVSGQRRLVDLMRASIKGDQHLAHVVNKFDAALEDRIKMSLDDPIGLAIQDRIISPEEMVWDWENIPASISNSLKVAERAYIHTGNATGGLQKEIAIELVNKFDNAPVNSNMQGQETKLKLMTDIIAGSKDKAPLVFDQLAEHGLSGGTYVSALAAAQGDHTGATLLLRGGEFKNTDPGRRIVSESSQELSTFFRTNTMGAYDNYEEMYGRYWDAFTSAYSYMARGEGGYDKDIAKQALRLATGGLVEYNGRYYIPPSRYYDNGDFEDYIEEIYPEELYKMGHPTTRDLAKPKKIMQAVINGDAHLQYIGVGNDGTSNYAIVYNGKPVIDAKTDLPFRFRFMKEYVTRQQVQDHVDAYRLSQRADQVRSRKQIQNESTKLQDIFKKLWEIQKQSIPAYNTP